jgi:hypothetical protein
MGTKGSIMDGTVSNIATGSRSYTRLDQKTREIDLVLLKLSERERASRERRELLRMSSQRKR